MKKKDELYTALADKGAFEVVNETLSPVQLRVVGRVNQDKFTAWILVVTQLLTESQKPGSGWSCDISKNYQLGPGGAVRYGWRLIFQAAAGSTLDSVADGIIGAVVKSKKPAMVELDSQLLPGYREGQERGGQNARGKGASSYGRAVLGPGAAAQLRNGGR